jgi:RNA polymerase sigma-70 factor, ECF subfamily
MTLTTSPPVVMKSTPTLPKYTDSDTELVALSVRGDAKAFQHLMERYLATVYNHLYRMTHNHELSEEMAQEAFVKAYRNLGSFDGARSFKPWILRIASNAAISALRKQSNVVSLDAMEESGHAYEPAARTFDEPDDQLDRKLTSQALVTAMQTLDEKYRAALLLRYQNDLSYEEVADTLGLPLNTIRTRLRRGLEKLREILHKTTPEGGYL